MARLLVLLFVFTLGCAEAAVGKVYWRPNEYKSLEERRYGLYDTDSYSWLTPCVYTDYLDIIDGASTACLAGKWGVLDIKGQVLIPFVYDYLFYFYDATKQKDAKSGISAAQLNGKWGYINIKNEPVIPLIYDELQSSELNDQGDYIIVKLNGKYGVIGRDGKTLVPFAYDDMGFEECKTLRAFNADKGGTHCAVILEPSGTVREYTDVEGFYHFSRKDKELVWAVDAETGLLTFLRPDGTRLIEPAYTAVHGSLMPGFKDGMARVMKDGKYGFVDKSGTLAVQPRYAFPLDKRGNAVIELFAEPELLPTRQDRRRKAGLLQESMALELDEPWPRLAIGVSPYMFEEMCYRVAWEAKYGKNGCKTDGVGEFAAGLALVSIKGRYGYIGKDGAYVIEPQYESGSVFHRGERGKYKGVWAAAVQKGGKWGLIDRQGEVLGKFKYAGAYEALKNFEK